LFISIGIGEVGATIIGLGTIGMAIISPLDGPIMVDRDSTVFVITRAGMTGIVISRVGIEVVELSEDPIEVEDPELSEGLIEVRDLDLSGDLIEVGDPDLPENLIEVLDPAEDLIEDGVDLTEGLIKNTEVIVEIDDNPKVLQA